MPLLRVSRGDESSSVNPHSNVQVEWPPGVPGYIPGFMFQAETVHVRRSFPGTILRSLATAPKLSSALPIRPIFSRSEPRNTGPKHIAFIRRWAWRNINQNVIIDEGGLHYVSVIGADNSPGGAVMGPRSRITSSLRVPAWNTSPPTLTPTGQGGGQGGVNTLRPRARATRRNNIP